MARPSKPWYRRQRDAWYVTIGNKKVALGVTGQENRAAAVRNWHRLMAVHDATPTAVPAEPPAATTAAQMTVAEAVALFINSTPHVKPATRELYSRHLARLVVTCPHFLGQSV